MFKKNANKDVKEQIERWGAILHNDLYRIHEDNVNKTKSKKEKELIGRLQGFKTSLALDSCSGLLYIYEDKIYKSPCDIDLDDIEDDNEELPITRVIDVDYLITFIEDIIRR